MNRREFIAGLLAAPAARLPKLSMALPPRGHPVWIKHTGSKR